MADTTNTTSSKNDQPDNFSDIGMNKEDTSLFNLLADRSKLSKKSHAPVPIDSGIRLPSPSQTEIEAQLIIAPSQPIVVPIKVADDVQITPSTLSPPLHTNNHTHQVSSADVMTNQHEPPRMPSNTVGTQPAAPFNQTPYAQTRAFGGSTLHSKKLNDTELYKQSSNTTKDRDTLLTGNDDITTDPIPSFKDIINSHYETIFDDTSQQNKNSIAQIPSGWRKALSFPTEGGSNNDSCNNNNSMNNNHNKHIVSPVMSRKNPTTPDTQFNQSLQHNIGEQRQVQLESSLPFIPSSLVNNNAIPGISIFNQQTNPQMDHNNGPLPTSTNTNTNINTNTNTNINAMGTGLPCHDNEPNFHTIRQFSASSGASLRPMTLTNASHGNTYDHKRHQQQRQHQQLSSASRLGREPTYAMTTEMQKAEKHMALMALAKTYTKPKNGEPAPREFTMDDHLADMHFELQRREYQESEDQMVELANEAIQTGAYCLQGLCKRFKILKAKNLGADIEENNESYNRVLSKLYRKRFQSSQLSAEMELATMLGMSVVKTLRRPVNNRDDVRHTERKAQPEVHAHQMIRTSPTGASHLTQHFENENDDGMSEESDYGIPSMNTNANNFNTSYGSTNDKGTESYDYDGGVDGVYSDNDDETPQKSFKQHHNPLTLPFDLSDMDYAHS